MTEIATDFVSDEGQPDSSAEEGSVETLSQDDMPEMGLGMLETDDAEDDPYTETEQTTRGFDKETVARPQPQTELSQAEKDRREADRYFQQNRQAELERERALTAREQAFSTREQASQPQAPVQQSLQEQMQTDAKALRDYANQTNDPAQRQELLNQATGVEYVQSAIVQGVERKLAEMGLDGYKDVAQSVRQMQDVQRVAQEKVMREQAQDAYEIFGEDAVNNPATLRFINRNRAALGEINPATGANYTIPELVGQATGRTAQEQAGIRQNGRNQKRNAKQGAAPQGRPASANVSAGGTISNAAAIAEINQTM
tara:strand:- start:3850 stop:4791 length:942 start_codon:yes stop_codon:yes gene_type:complete